MKVERSRIMDNGKVELKQENKIMFWILGRGLRRALIRCTLGSGKSEKGLGFWKGGHKEAMGDKGE
jgi:hypothetical protein